MMESSGNAVQVRVLNLSVQGASHIRRGKECQDASFSSFGENYAIAIVSDGHGGDDYVRSAVGAEYACQAAAKCIQEFLRDTDKAIFAAREKDREEQLVRLEGSIISLWNTLVTQHYASNPFTPEEDALLSPKAHRRYMEEKKIESAYGTTMIAAVWTPDCWFGLQIGDGRCVVVSGEGEFSQPIPWDEKCFLNATTSICDSDAIHNFRHFYSNVLPAAILIGSDGVDDCFSNEDQLNQLYKTVLYSFANSGFEDAVKELGDYLPRLSVKGSGDDVSISAILDMRKICRLDMVKELSAPADSGGPSPESDNAPQRHMSEKDEKDSATIQDQTEVLANEQQER